MKSNSIKFTALIVTVLSFTLISNVNAEVKENSFTNEKCIKDEAWKSDAKTKYSVNNDLEVYQLDGISYDEYISNGSKGNYYIFYTTSENGRELNAYVPNYNEVIKDINIKAELYKNGIITTDKCDGSYMVTKTLIGATKVQENQIENESKPEENVEKEQSNKQEETEDMVPKVTTPNTASPIQISGIVIGVILLGVAVYGVLKKYNVIKIWRKK